MKQTWTLEVILAINLKSEFLIGNLMSQLRVNENEIFIYQNLSLGIYNQKQIKFCK